MAATKQDLIRWFQEGKKDGATHMIVMCDSYDYEDYPVYVESGEDAKAKAEEHGKKSMQQLMEVYNLNISMEDQMKEHRAFNY